MKRPYMKIYCIECGKEILNPELNRKFCSKECDKKFRLMSPIVKQRKKEYEQRPEIKKRQRGYHKKYYENNKEKIRIIHKRWNQENKEKIKKYRQKPKYKRERRNYQRALSQLKKNHPKEFKEIFLKENEKNN